MVWAAVFFVLSCVPDACPPQEYPLSSTLAVLVDDLGSAERDVRINALEELTTDLYLLDLMDYRREAKPLLPRLIYLLRHRDKTVRLAAIRLIARMSLDARSASAGLKQLVVDERETEQVRWQAAQAMLYITPEKVSVLRSILPAPKSFPRLDPEDDSVVAEDVALGATAIAFSLLESGHAKSEIPYLLKATSHEYPLAIRALTIATLGELGDEAKSATPTLWLLLGNEEEILRDLAACAIVKIEKNRNLVERIAKSLQLSGSERDEFVSEFCALIDDYNERRERRARNPNLSVLIHDLKYGLGPLRRQSLRWLADIGPGAASAIPEIRKALGDSDSETRQLATHALTQISGSMRPKQQHGTAGWTSRPCVPRRYLRNWRTCRGRRNAPLPSRH